MPPRRILVITGASGSGKTAILQHLASRVGADTALHHFDSIGVPSSEVMTREHGSPEAWQANMTHRWITSLATDPAAVELAVLEGQVRPGVVRDAFDANGVRVGRILLLDCTPEVRASRLCGPRGQPELANSQMMAWAAYLRGQADALHAPVLDTTELSLEAAAAEVEKHLAALRATDLDP